MADGSFTEALRLLEHVENDQLPALRNWFNAIFTNNGIGLVAFADEWSKAGREGIRNLFGYTLHLLEGAVRATYLPNAISTYPAEEGQFIQRLAARKLSIESLKKMMEVITDASYHIERNAHTKSVILACCLKMKDAAKGVPAG
jgi:DNA polymerase-3 subunit delta'